MEAIADADENIWELIQRNIWRFSEDGLQGIQSGVADKFVESGRLAEEECVREFSEDAGNVLAGLVELRENGQYHFHHIL